MSNFRFIFRYHKFLFQHFVISSEKGTEKMKSVKKVKILKSQHFPPLVKKNQAWFGKSEEPSYVAWLHGLSIWASFDGRTHLKNRLIQCPYFISKT